jgi:hypothetical protein
MNFPYSSSSHGYAALDCPQLRLYTMLETASVPSFPLIPGTTGFDDSFENRNDVYILLRKRYKQVE